MAIRCFKSFMGVQDSNRRMMWRSSRSNANNSSRRQRRKRHHGNMVVGLEEEVLLRPMIPVQAMCLKCILEEVAGGFTGVVAPKPKLNPRKIKMNRAWKVRSRRLNSRSP